jgi:hypothetical protein
MSMITDFILAHMLPTVPAAAAAAIFSTRQLLGVSAVCAA